MAVKAVVIGGIEVPVAYNGYVFFKNKIHSVNTGRTNTGKMVGTIVDIKKKAEVTLIPISPLQADAIDRIVSDADNMFQQVEILTTSGNREIMTAYFGDISYPWLSTTLGDGGLIQGIKFSIIEQ